MKRKGGFTLIELGVVIAVIAILATFLVVSLTGMDESRDAGMVQSVQASLQSVVTQASTRLDVPPSQLSPQNVINAVRINIPNQAVLDNTYRLSFPQSGRGAQFAIANNGDVRITQLINFTSFTVNPTDGTLQKH